MPSVRNDGQTFALQSWQPCAFTHYLQKLLQSAFYKRCSTISLTFQNSAYIKMTAKDQLKIAKDQIARAINCDTENRLFEAQYHYINGMEKLRPFIDNETDVTKKNVFNQHMNNYLQRSEMLKKILHQFTYECSNVKTTVILEDSTGHTYKSLMGEYFDDRVIELVIEEPYLLNKYQIYNLLRFMEMAVKKSPRLKFVSLITNESTDSDFQSKMFEQLRENLNAYNIFFNYNFINTTLHVRKIVLSNGYIIKCDRGLDIYKSNSPVCGLGFFDYYYRKCKHAEIDIMRSNHKLHH